MIFNFDDVKVDEIEFMSFLSSVNLTSISWMVMRLFSASNACLITIGACYPINSEPALGTLAHLSNLRKSRDTYDN